VNNYVFVYGSCMNKEDLNRTTKAEFVSAATLYDYTLGFTRHSENRQGGVADILKSPGDYLEGCLFKVQSLAALDRREGHPTIYKRRKIKVLVHSQMTFGTVWVYEVVNKSKQEFKPSEEYAYLIREGAKQYLSDDYFAQLEFNLDQFRVSKPKKKVKSFVATMEEDFERYQLDLFERVGLD
jgi:cation transport regulator ChaC